MAGWRPEARLPLFGAQNTKFLYSAKTKSPITGKIVCTVGRAVATQLPAMLFGHKAAGRYACQPGLEGMEPQG